MTAVWDHKLWDTYNPQLYNFTKYNQDFLKQYTEFLERRSRVEEKYARELRKICKDFKPKEFDKKEKIKFSIQSAFDDMLTELTSSANQHETLRDELLKSSKDVKASLKEMQGQSSLAEKKIASLVRDLDRNRSQLEGVRQQYQRAFAELRKARDDYNANKDNKDITKNEEERFHQVYLQKQSQFEDRKNGYAKELTDYNASQQRYYMQQLPEQLAMLEDHEKRLASVCQLQFQFLGDSELQALNIRTKCAQSLRDKANLVNANADIAEFLRVTASGNPVPPDVPFEDLGSNDSISQQQINKLPKGNTIREKKPAQHRRRLEEQLKLKDEELDKSNKTVDAMQKLLQTYQQNPKLGDSGMVQQQMQQAFDQREQIVRDRTEILRELESLGVDIANLSAAPTAVVAGSNPILVQQQQPISVNTNIVSGPSAFADEFADDPPTPTQKPVAPAVPPPPAVSAAPSQPMVAMLYDFNDASQPDNLAVVAGERLFVLNRDADWTLVRRSVGNTAEQGYVPTAYMADL